MHTTKKVNGIVEANTNFSRVNSVIPRFFLGKAVYIATVYLSSTAEHSPWLGTLSVNVSEFKVLRLA